MVEQAQFRKVEEESVVRRRLFADGSFVETAGYSLEEHGPIGTWIDGKPIFRIVVQLTGALDVSTGVNAALTAVDTLIRGSAIVRDRVTGGLFGASLPLTIGGGSAQPGVEVNTATGSISVTHTGVTTLNETVLCILEYTKQ